MRAMKRWLGYCWFWRHSWSFVDQNGADMLFRIGMSFDVYRVCQYCRKREYAYTVPGGPWRLEGWK